MYNFCTLFNSYYLVKGIAMHRSLAENSPDSHLFILAMDNLTYEYLISSELINVTVISLKDFENDHLKEVKKDRNFAEYCWTCSSSLISYCLEEYQLPSCTYVDADIYFYDDPGLLLTELDDSGSQVLITEHGFDQDHKHLEAYGRFCIQFLCFTNRPAALEILRKWKAQCIEWCYSWAEAGRFGDQKYLDSWPASYPDVHILKNIGFLAPWNITRFSVRASTQSPKTFEVFEKITGKSAPLVFYHFHDLKLYSNNTFCLVNGYDVSEVKGKLYYPYLELLSKIEAEVKEKMPSFNPESLLRVYTSDNFFRSMRARFDIIIRKQKLKFRGKLSSS